MRRTQKASLTDRRKRFVAEYLVDLNGTQAAIRAGYSSKTAQQQGSRLLLNAVVQEEIQKRMAKHVAKLQITTERVLNEIAKLAFVDPRKFFNADGSPKEIAELDDDTAAALAGMDVREEFAGEGEDRKFVGFTKKFKLADKGQNLERLGRYLQLFKDRVELSGAVEVEVKPGSLAELAAKIQLELGTSSLAETTARVQRALDEEDAS